MPKVLWKKILKREKGFFKSKKESSSFKNAERKRRFDIRKRAQTYIKDLHFILKNIKNISAKPENDFAKIFKNETDYFTLLETLRWAYEESYKATVKLATEEAWQELQIAAVHAGFKMPKTKDMYNTNYRLELVRKLRRKERRDGKPYLEKVRQYILLDKIRKQQIRDRKKKVTCPKCGSQQHPVEFVVCNRCRHQGPVIGNLYEGFSKQEQERREKAAIQYMKKHPELRKLLAPRDFLRHIINFEEFYEEF